MRRIFPAYSVTMILTAALLVALDVGQVQAAGLIYIRADGRVDPATANITTTDNCTYTFTGNNMVESMVVERDDIVIDGAGYGLQGSGVLEARGIDLMGRTNVTVQHVRLYQFYWGIYLSSSSRNTIRWNTVKEAYRVGIQLDLSNFNLVSANTITNSESGISLLMSSHNSVRDNNLTANLGPGIYLSACMNTSVAGNVMADNGIGIWLGGTSGITIFHNSFIDNQQPAFSIDARVYSWDAGYPGGGNYWNHLVDTDVYKGKDQNETGSDGVWDHSYSPLPDEVNMDRYPLTTPFGWFPAGDVDGDRDVDVDDIDCMAGVYHATYPDPQYDRLCDLDLDDDIDLFDVVKAAGNYGKSWQSPPPILFSLPMRA